MLQIGHRESHDVDVFLDDPQVLPYLNPQTQSYELQTSPSSYETDGPRSLKLSFDDIGEVDFICAGQLSEAPTMMMAVRGREVSVETPLEIITKKLVYRGSHIQPRDMFDIAAVVAQRGSGDLVHGLRQHGRECGVALQAIERFAPAAATAVMSKLMIRSGFESLPETAQDTVIGLLREVVAKPA
ncbi:hypothetical protein CXZ10_15290 [Pleomorphomonas diazotrophica]|uniref:Nucleotidyl transferase AbiEii/AbiGii toxin family protein n=1 Tax=Pleomorphomonas diazotrophica TaxID=1166257 RepID=A0A1I4ULA3_9HYPH|nr:nucleotidyl transferase AbiEii/AbiGii toxin family protein [Pleomorphomonas diazotrophica]PKR88380.1 hypothetical protein CXZ10_15290 [Pleomorphomonas diazotrophica]SFM89708.1 hypothetical protein SAMN05192571_108131 [Pleomorphomonas diazotrophica]